MRLSDDDLAALAASLAGSLYGTLCVEAEGFSAVLTRDGAGWYAETTLRTETSLTLEPGVEADVAADHMGPAVRAPLVGTFYRAPRPGAPPFVEPGSAVTPETVVGIIETMKLMNSVHAGVSGTIVEIVAPDASFVENGKVLMIVEEHAS